MHVVEILDQLESDNSRLWKESILGKNVGNKLLARVFRLALDPYINYGVAHAKVNSNNVGTDVDHDDSLSGFLDLLEFELAPRKLSGNAAKNAVTGALVVMHPNVQKWAARILLKNLRCGVSTSTVDKVWHDLIRHFDVMLAVVVPVADKQPVGVTYPRRIEPKLDGLRMIAIKHLGAVTMYTRNGNEIETLPQIRSWLESHPEDDFILDGEIMGGDWNESNSVVMSSKRAKDDSNMRYNVFDAMSYDEWVNQSPKVPLKTRVEIVKRITTVVPVSCVRQVPGITALNVHDVLEFYAKCLDEGYEGVMIKDLESLYEFKRTKKLLKFKPIVTFEGSIVGWYKGAEGKKREGLFAGFHVLLPNGIITRVGNGYSDILKQEINNVGPDKYVGKIVEIEAQPDPLTEDGLSKDGKARFPVLMRFRQPQDVDPKVVESFNVWREKNG